MDGEPSPRNLPRRAPGYAVTFANFGWYDNDPGRKPRGKSRLRAFLRRLFHEGPLTVLFGVESSVGPM